jgi:hypothetical protein
MRVKSVHQKVFQIAVAGLWLAAWPVHAQTASTPKAAAVRGDSIGGAPSPAPASAPASPVVVTKDKDGVANADFETLASYTFTVPDMTASNHVSVAQAEKQIPAVIKQLDGQTVRIRGFMMPIKEVQGKTTEFLITRSQPSCCFSGATEITEFVTVKATGKGFDTMMDDAISVVGKLHVGAVTDSGFIVGLYELDGEKVIASKN